jgi:hypothetical protein
MSKQRYPQTIASTTSTGTVRKGRERYSHAKADARKDLRRDQAEDRQAKYDALSTTDKLAQLPSGICERQRARLTKQLALEKQAPAKTVKQAPLTEAQKGAKAVKRAQDAVAALPVTKK